MTQRSRSSFVSSLRTDIKLESRPVYIYSIKLASGSTDKEPCDLIAGEEDFQTRSLIPVGFLAFSLVTGNGQQVDLSVVLISMLYTAVL